MKSDEALRPKSTAVAPVKPEPKISMVLGPPPFRSTGVSVSIETWPGPPTVPADEALTERPVAGEQGSPRVTERKEAAGWRTTPGPPDRAAASDVPGVECAPIPMRRRAGPRARCSGGTWLRLEGQHHTWGLRSAHLIPTFREHASGVGLDARGRAEPPQWPRALHRSGGADMAPMNALSRTRRERLFRRRAESPPLAPPLELTPVIESHQLAPCRLAGPAQAPLPRRGAICLSGTTKRTSRPPPGASPEMLRTRCSSTFERLPATGVPKESSVAAAAGKGHRSRWRPGRQGGLRLEGAQ